MTKRLERFEVEYLESKMIERYKSDCERMGIAPIDMNAKDGRVLYPKYGTGKGKHMFWTRDEKFDFTPEAEDSLTAVMIKDEKVEKAMVKLKQKGGFWYPNPDAHFSRNQVDHQRIPNGVLQIYLMYAGIKPEQLSHDAKTWAQTNKRENILSEENDTTQNGAESTKHQENVRIDGNPPKIWANFWLLLGGVILFMLGSGVMWLIKPNDLLPGFSPEMETSTINVLKPSDPLGITGEWRYIVRADFDEPAKKLLGFGRTKQGTDTLIDMYDRLGGHIKIDSILSNRLSYNIDGARDEQIKGNFNEIERNPIPLKFSNVSHSTHSGSKTLFFEFELRNKDKTDNSRGYVFLDSINEAFMTGHIIYLYRNLQYRKVEIQFHRPDRKIK